MKLRTIDALPTGPLSRNPDVILAFGVAAIIGMMILPLPSALLDGLLALNMAFAALILVSSLLSEKPLSISTFPTLLLITTLYRLSLNISTTRMILSQGKAGEVIGAFGDFVLRGDVVVGMVIFLIITLVQFMVIGKGAERVAEVGARFTLDAMPGKQMSIDAGLRAGSIDEDEAQEQRVELGRESQFYGAMDGAMKFIKGDAIAGLIITALNLVAGLIIGVARNNMGFGQAIEMYSVLTVGDGLVSQIPALLITLSAGVLTTRVASKNAQATLGDNLKAELFTNPKVLGIGACFSMALGLIPGLPFVPFAVIATGLAIAANTGVVRRRMRAAQASSEAESFKEKLEEKVKQAKAQRAMVDNMAPAVTPVALDIGPDLSRALGFLEDTDGQETELVGVMIPQLRDALYMETGVKFPGVRVRAFANNLEPSAIVVRLKDVPILEKKVASDSALAVETPERLRRLGIDAKPTEHPVNGGSVSLIPLQAAEAVDAAGINSWTPAGVVMLHLAATLKQHAKSFVGPQEVGEMIERLEKVYPTLVKEVVPKMATLAQIVEILRRLVDEGVSIRDMKSILESLADFGGQETDGVMLTEMVRASLSLQLSHTYAGNSGRLSVVLLDAAIEDLVRGAITHTTNGSYLALEPELQHAVLASIAKAVQPVAKAGVRPLILTSAEIRRYVRKLVEGELPEVAVLSFQELPAQLTIQPLGRVSLDDDLLNAA